MRLDDLIKHYLDAPCDELNANTVFALKAMQCMRDTFRSIAAGADKYGWHEWCDYCENYDECIDCRPTLSDCVKFGYEAIAKMAQDVLEEWEAIE